jgi:hypothetical protein
MCLICGWIYDEAAGDAETGLLPGTAWAAVPMNWCTQGRLRDGPHLMEEPTMAHVLNESFNG